MKALLKKNLPFYLALIFQAFPIYYMVQGSYPAGSWLLLMIFLTAYFYLIHRSRAIRWLDDLALLVMLAFIAYTSFVWSPAMFLNMFYVTNIFTWIFGEGLGSRRFQVFLLLSFANLLGLMIRPISIEEKLTMLAVSVFALGFSIYMADTIEKEAQEKEHLKHHESINLLMAENERNRIGQDLHDSLGHVFATLSVKTELAKTLLENGAIDAARKEVAEVHELTRSSMMEVRSIVANLKSHRVEEELKIVSNLLDLAEVGLQVEGEEKLGFLSASQSAVMAMVLRELINNLLKHSRAKSCRLIFSTQAGTFYLTYEDDGLGFKKVTGQELHSIKDRMLRQGGAVEITYQSQPTRIEVRIPLEEV